VESLAAMAARLEDATAALAEASLWMGEHLATDVNDLLAGATPYLEMFGLTIGGWLMGVSALAAQERLDETGDDTFLRTKVDTARFYFEHKLPEVRGLLASTTAGAETVMAVDPEHLLG
jgi:hypothetical protein